MRPTLPHEQEVARSHSQRSAELFVHEAGWLPYQPPHPAVVSVVGMLIVDTVAVAMVPGIVVATVPAGTEMLPPVPNRTLDTVS